MIRWKTLLCLLLLFLTQLNGGLFQHLKKAENKAGTHSMRNIDFIYMINLDQRPEKLQTSLNQLIPCGILPYRFSAVNGWELSLETINDVGVKYSPEMEGNFMATSYHLNGNYEPSHETIQNYGQTYFCHCMARGTIGCALSHISVLQDAYDSGYETIWIMEDDIMVLRDPRILPDLIDRLDQIVGKDGWDILFTDRDIRNGEGNSQPCYWSTKRPDFISYTNINDYGSRTLVSNEFYRIGARYGSHSMIIRRNGIRKLLQFFRAHQIYLPYDLDYVLPQGIKLFAILDDVVTNQPGAHSDNGGANYLKK